MTPEGAPRDGAGRFHNTEPFEVRSLAEVLRWQWQARRKGVPATQPTPTQAPDLDFIARNAGGALQPAVTWLGHATVLAQFGGLNLLTDPHCSHRASPFSFSGPQRAQPPAIALDRCPASTWSCSRTTTTTIWMAPRCARWRSRQVARRCSWCRWA